MADTPKNRKNVRRGRAVETECRSLFADAGFPGSYKQVMSGSLSWIHHDLSGDVRAGFTIAGRPVTVECKARRKGFSELYKWLADPSIDLLYLRRDRASPLIAMDWRTFVYFLSLVPKEDRLPAVTDRLAELKRVAATSDYAASCLRQIEAMKTDEITEAVS